MYYSRSLAFIGLVTAAPAVAFVSPTSAASRTHSSLGATRDPNNGRSTPPDAIRNLAAASFLTLGLLFPSRDALAAQDTVYNLPMNDHALYSSTVELSTEYKTMDFSMPGSYNGIADPNAFGADTLTTTTSINSVTSKKTVEKKAAKETASKKTDSKKTASKKTASKEEKPAKRSKEDVAAAKAEKIAQRKASEAEDAAREVEARKEVDANIKEARLAKIAAREAAQKEAAAAAADEKEEASLKGAKFVDTSMPSYD